MAQQENRDIEKLEAYSFPELQQIWRDEQLGEPPRIRRKLMASLLAYHLQNKTVNAGDKMHRRAGAKMHQ